MSSKRVLYGVHMSPPVRAPRMTLEALGLDYEFKVVDFQAGENKTPEYLKKNPQHTVPLLEDEDGSCVFDSHAIMAYLVRKYGKQNDPLYPKGFYERAVVDQRLHFENGNLFMGVCRQKLVPLIRGEPKKEEVPEILKSVNEAYELLETFMGAHKFIAGNEMTIADLSVVTSVAYIDAFVPIQKEKYAKLFAWFKTMKKLPYYEKVNAEGMQLLKEKIKFNLLDLV